jgi:dTDP-4-dehydrorhamnose reductase
MFKSIISVVGSSGSVGLRLHPYLEANLPSSFQVEGTYFTQKTNPKSVLLDITNKAAIEQYIEENQPASLIWLSGSKDVRKCELDSEFSYQLNSRPVESLVKSIEKVSPDTKVIYISTDYVFDGIKGYYHDNDICNPVTNYGRSKLIAEKILQSSNVDYLILRTSAIMIENKGFLGWLLSQLRSGKIVDLFSNTYFSPTPIELLNQVIAGYIVMPSFGKKIVHMAGPRISRFQFGLDLVETLGIKPSQIRNVLADFGSSTFQQDLSLITSKELQQISMNFWNELIKEVLHD